MTLPSLMHNLINQLTMSVLSGLKESFYESKPPFASVILVTLIAIVVGYLKFFVSPLLGKKLPPGLLGFPFLGETISFIKAQKQDKTTEWFQERVDKYGPVFKTSILGSKVVVMAGQTGNRFLFSGGGDNGLSYNQPTSVARILGKYSFFELSGARHKLVRSAVVSFLKPESIQRFVGEMDSIVQQLLFQDLDGKDSVGIVALMKKITFNLTCSIFFGLPSGKEKDDLSEDFSTALKGAWTIPLNFPGTTFQTALQARGRICRLLSKLVKNRRKEMEEGISKEDIISSLLILIDENGEPLMEEEVLDIFQSLVTASHDTTTIVLSLLIRLLARDPDIASKVLEEQREVVKAKEGRDGKLTWGDMQMMKYTWRVAQEVMRLTPPVSGNFRRITRDTSFGGFDIPKGWQVFWVASGTHMDKNIFEDPEKFDPSRFENSTKSLPPYTYVPFGAGPRICPGAEFAKIEVLLIIHHMITRYRWTEMVPDEPITREPMPYPAMGLPINLYLRKDI